jgi:hypothetical protein
MRARQDALAFDDQVKYLACLRIAREREARGEVSGAAQAARRAHNFARSREQDYHCFRLVETYEAAAAAEVVKTKAVRKPKTNRKSNGRRSKVPTR